MELHRAWEQTRLVTLASSAQGKLAHLLLGWTNEVGQQTPEGVRIRVTMTREEMGESIGASRETVSRLLTGFKRRGLIRTSGSSMFILKPDNLQELSAN